MTIKSVDISINITPSQFVDLCPYCLGSGKLKTMRMAATYDAGTVRVSDTKVTCNYCNGTGRRR